MAIEDKEAQGVSEWEKAIVRRWAFVVTELIRAQDPDLLALVQAAMPLRLTPNWSAPAADWNIVPYVAPYTITCSSESGEETP